MKYELRLKSGLRYYWPVFPLAILLFHHFFCYFGHFGIDDMWYARIAAEWSNGDINLLSADHYEYRWTIIGFTALVYQLFGINDFSSGLIPLIQTLLICTIIYELLRSNLMIAFIGVAFFITDQWTLFYSDKLMPDSFVAAYGFAALFFVYQSSFTKKIRFKVIYGLVSSLLMFLCFLSKGSFILYLPTFLILLIWDIFKGKNQILWVSFMITSAIIGIIYFGYFAIEGDWLARINAINNNSYFNTCSYDQLPVQHLVNRISCELWDSFLKSGLLGLIIIGLYSLKNFGQYTYWKVVFISLLLSANFMTISWQSYVPLCPEIRHYLFLVPPITIVAAIAFYDFFKTKSKFNILIPISLLILSIWSMKLNYASSYTLYLPLFILTFSKCIIPFIKPKYFIAILFPLLLITPQRICRHANTSSKYDNQKQVFKAVVQPIIDSLDQQIIVTNHVQKNFCEYYLGFNAEKSQSIFQYDKVPQDFQGEIIVFANGYSRFLSGLDYHALPDFLKAYSEKKETVPIRKIYQMDEILVLGVQATPEILAQLSNR